MEDRLRRLRIALAALALSGACGLAAGCGADYPDLMAVSRSGELPGAQLELVVNDGGTASCNGGRDHQLPPRLLLDARDVVRALTEETLADKVYPRAPGALLRFRLRTEDGGIMFSDTDAVGHPELGRLIAVTRRAAKDVCGLAR